MIRIFQSKILKIGIVGLFLFSAIVLPSFVVLTENVSAQVRLDALSGAGYGGAATPVKAATAVEEPTENNSRVGAWIGHIILNLAGGITWLGGRILETAVEELVLNMGTWINGTGPGTGVGPMINSLWTTIRDIANLAFIFGFIFVGIRTIIDSESANTKRFLASIIIGALLVNFSLFFTKIIIDFSNFTAVQIHSAMFAPGSPSKNLSETFMDQLGVVSLYSSNTSVDKLTNLSKTGSFTYYFMGAIFLMIAGFVLAIGGILLIIRYVALIFIMIFSPLLFAATVFPQTQQYASRLWKELISYSFFAPIFLFLIFVSLKVLGSTRMNNTFSDALTGEKDSFDVILNFLISIFFLIMSVQIAKSLGVRGADTVISTAKKAGGAATAGMAAAAGRGTLGRYMHNVSTNKNLLDKQGRKGVSGFVARQKLKASRVIADSSFDARNVAGAGKGLGIGEGRKGGYKTTLKEVEEKEMKFAKSLGEVDDDDFHVKKYKKNKEDAEAEIKSLKEDRTVLGNSPEDILKKKEIISKIRRLDKVVKDNQRDYAREKQRRVLGGVHDSKEIERATEESKAEWKKEQESLDVAWKQYNEMTDELEKDVAEKTINKLEMQVADAKKRYEEERSQISSDEGYAKILEDSNILTSWSKGRLIHQEKEAGKSIRKAFEKLTKKSEDDKRTDSLIDAVKTSKS